MPKREAEEPGVVVRERVDVELSPSEVEAALRHWFETRIAPDRAPRAKEGTLHVSMSCGNDEFHGARLSYEPEPRA